MVQTNWECPFCRRGQVLTSDTSHYGTERFAIGDSKHGKVGISFSAFRCVNLDCNEVTLKARFCTVYYEKTIGKWREIGTIDSWQLRPYSMAKPQPDYIPKPIRDDYFEACLVKDRSPKAAATLARRCLQGMIRNFCGISKPRLSDEIKELRRLTDEGYAPKGVESETIEAIDAVRLVGNIGAHMERDIDVIVEVDDGEAQALIELIEMLFDEWYVARHQRQEKLTRVKAIAAEKAAEIEAERTRMAQERLSLVTDNSVNPTRD